MFSNVYCRRSLEKWLGRNDTAADPHEVKNLADDPQYKSEIERLQAKLKAFQGLPGMNAKLEIDSETKSSLTASVSGKTEYLAALGVKDWDDCDMD